VNEKHVTQAGFELVTFKCFVQPHTSGGVYAGLGGQLAKQISSSHWTEIPVNLVVREIWHKKTLFTRLLSDYTYFVCGLNFCYPFHIFCFSNFIHIVVTGYVNSQLSSLSSH
jgi:hypothetical protein